MTRRALCCGVLVLAIMLAIPPAARAQSIPSLPLSHGTLAFDADATLGAFTGTTSTLTGQMTGGELADVRGWVQAPAKSLTSNNGHRDRDMASSLEIDKFPTLRFDLEGVTPGETRGDSTAVTLHGHMTLHGQTRPVDIPGWVWIKPASVRFRGALPVNCKDYGIGGLSKMLGIFKMNEMITVRADVTFEN